LGPPWNIGIVGTFDVENYGDLLFPLIAEAELRRRLGEVRVLAFSYYSKNWPYEVTSVRELPEIAASLDGLLIGGGFLIRFDRDVAPGYEPPSSAIHHPTGYWLTPALIAHEHGVPVVWNAPGMHCNAIPRWAEPLVKLAFEQSRYIAVRDEPSRQALSSMIAADLVSVVPDPGFGIARLLPKERSRELEAFRDATGINGPYILVQASVSMAAHADLFSRIDGVQSVAMPISPVLTESTNHFSDDFLKPRSWPHPLVLAELIAEAEAVAGHSYHLAITALMNGVPVFSPIDRNVGKFTALRQFDGIYRIPENRAELLANLTRRTPPAVDVDWHWDRVAVAIEQGRSTPQVAMSQFWQTAPALLERGAARGEALRMIDLDRIMDSRLQSEPFQWGSVDRLYSAANAAALAKTYPRDHFRLITGYGGEKDYEYEARPLIGMGASEIAFESHLSDAWRSLSRALLSPAYRETVAAISGCDLRDALLEVNVFHYGPGASLGPHSDLPDKIVTHVLYFNEEWDAADGGCLQILSAKDERAVVHEVLPLIGNSAFLVRSESSWHAVSRVTEGRNRSRRSVTATFYRAGSVSSMWPPGETFELHDYRPKRGWSWLKDRWFR
jgi:hypothetical protein